MYFSSSSVSYFEVVLCVQIWLIYPFFVKRHSLLCHQSNAKITVVASDIRM